jgi:hypothetical protein
MTVSLGCFVAFNNHVSMQNLNICIFGPITYEKEERRGEEMEKKAPCCHQSWPKDWSNCQLVKIIFISASPLYL